jgi:hypothetical protein
VPRVSSFELPISASHIHLLRVLPVVGCRSKTPTAPTVEEILAQMERQPPAAQENTEPAAAATEEAAATEAQEEAPAEAGLVDIASILSAPTVTVVRSSL